MRRRRASQTDPFNFKERAWLRVRLPAVERAPNGLAGGLPAGRWMWRGQEPRVGRLSVVLRGLIERGLLEVAETEAGPRCLFTEAGMTGLRAYFSRQPVDFRVLFPRLRHELALDEPLGAARRG